MSKQRKSSEDSTLKQQCLTSRIKNGKRRAKLEPQLQFSFQKVQSDLLIIQVWDIQFNTTFICQLEAAPTVRFNYVEQQLKDKDYKIMQRSNSILQLQLGGLFLIFENKLQITLDDLKLELKNEKQKNNDLEKRVRELEQRCKNIEWKQLDMNDSNNFNIDYQYRFTLNDGYLYYATNMQTNRFGYIDTSNRNYYIAANNKRSSNSGHTTVKIQYKQK